MLIGFTNLSVLRSVTLICNVFFLFADVMVSETKLSKMMNKRVFTIFLLIVLLVYPSSFYRYLRLSEHGRFREDMLHQT